MMSPPCRACRARRAPETIAAPRRWRADGGKGAPSPLPSRQGGQWGGEGGRWRGSEDTESGEGREGLDRLWVSVDRHSQTSPCNSVNVGSPRFGLPSPAPDLVLRELLQHHRRVHGPELPPPPLSPSYGDVGCCPLKSKGVAGLPSHRLSWGFEVWGESCPSLTFWGVAPLPLSDHPQCAGCSVLYEPQIDSFITSEGPRIRGLGGGEAGRPAFAVLGDDPQAGAAAGQCEVPEAGSCSMARGVDAWVGADSSDSPE